MSSNQKSTFLMDCCQAYSARLQKKYPLYGIHFNSIKSFLLHSQFEAWWVGVGSVQLPLFFVYLGLTNINSVDQPK